MDLTILIPSRNRATLFERAVRSVLQQAHESYEILVVYDGSDGDRVNRRVSE